VASGRLPHRSRSISARDLADSQVLGEGVYRIRCAEVYESEAQIRQALTDFRILVGSETGNELLPVLVGQRCCRLPQA
jgi:hypothetical protein